ncbi:hypothetical protein [Pseudodesulfovibrio sp.]|uniref:hypothetical protein n=1 Tax=unclassified Pseudodesulfovibrio TaxID=2661612 RepID=UPI003AFFD6A2
MKKNIETDIITLLVVLVIIFVLITFIDPSENHLYSSGFFAILIALLPFYIDKKYYTQSDSEQKKYQPSKTVKKTDKHVLIFPELQFIILITVILILNNIFFLTFQYSVDQLKLSERMYTLLLVSFSGTMFFLSILPLSALGSILIGMRNTGIRWRHCIVSISFTFGSIAILTASHWITIDAFPLTNILKALFIENVNPMLALHGEMLLAVLTISVDLLLILIMSIWLLIWAKLGNWRFKRMISRL